MNGLTLYELTSEQAQIEQLLIENGGELTPEIEQALAENQQALSAKLDGYNRILRRFEGSEGALDAEIKRLQALKKTAQNAQKSLKNHLKDAMQVNGITKLESDLCKAYFRTTEVVDVDEDFIDQFADQMCDATGLLPSYISVKFEVSKTALKEAIKGGEPVKGARLADSVSLIIK